MRQSIRFAALLWGLFFLVNSTSANDFTFLTHPIKPFTFEENGELRGFAVEVVKEMMKKRGHPEEFKVYPFKRALLTVQSVPGHALFIAAKRPEREDTVKWVGPLISSGVYLYKKKGSTIQIESLEDARELSSVGVHLGNADNTFLQGKGFENLVTTGNQLQSLQMLDKGRVEVTPISELVMPELAKQGGIHVSRIERTNVKLYDSVLFLVFSKEATDKEVARWQSALDELIASGRYQEIFDKYVQ